MVVTPKPTLLLETVTIAAGESVSDVLDLTVRTLGLIVMPPQWVLAPLTFQISLDDVDYYDLYYVTTGEVTIPVIAGTSIIPPQEMSTAFNYIKFRSGSHTNPVPQPIECQFGVGIIA